MTDQQALLNQITAFETHYHYDAGFLKDMVQHAPGSYDHFQHFQTMARHRELLSTEVFWIAKIASMQQEDCGGCLQLNLNMAREKGLPVAWLSAALDGGSTLPAHLQQVLHYARQVAAQGSVEPELMEAMQQAYSKGQLLELGVAIASAKVYPTIKRALGLTQACQAVTITL